MKKLRVTSQTKKNGSSKAEKSEEKALVETTQPAEVQPSPKSKAKNGRKKAPVEASAAIEAEAKPNGSSKKKNGKADPADATPPVEAEPKRRGRRAEEGEPLKRLLVFLSRDDIEALREKAGKGKVSTKVRELIKDYLAG